MHTSRNTVIHHRRRVESVPQSIINVPAHLEDRRLYSKHYKMQLTLLHPISLRLL